MNLPKMNSDMFRPKDAAAFRVHPDHTVSEQSVFNAVYKHIMFEQKRPGISDRDGCVYLGPDGARCGIGALMNEDEIKEYANAIDNLEGLVKLDQKQDKPILRRFFGNHIGLMAALQRAHDRGYMEADQVASSASEEHKNQVFLVEADKRFRAVADLWCLEVPSHPDL